MLNLLSITYQQLAVFNTLLCNCAQISYEADCFRNCTWVDNQCADITVCEAIDSQYTCNSSSMCLWIDQCVQFNGCGNYRFDDPSQCTTIGCHPGIQDENGNTVCSSVPNYRMCYKLLTEDTCNGRQNDGEICLWLGGKCINQVFNYCSDLNGIPAAQCNPVNHCVRYADDCYLIECGLFKKEDCGAHVLYLDQEEMLYWEAESIEPCAWDEKQNLCVVADNSIYNQDNCYLNTFGTSTWVEQQSECIECRFINTVLIVIQFMHYIIYF